MSNEPMTQSEAALRAQLDAAQKTIEALTKERNDIARILCSTREANAESMYNAAKKIMELTASLPPPTVNGPDGCPMVYTGPLLNDEGREILRKQRDELRAQLELAITHRDQARCYAGTVTKERDELRDSVRHLEQDDRLREIENDEMRAKLAEAEARAEKAEVTVEKLKDIILAIRREWGTAHYWQKSQEMKPYRDLIALSATPQSGETHGEGKG